VAPEAAAEAAAAPDYNSRWKATQILRPRPDCNVRMPRSFPP